MRALYILIALFALFAWDIAHNEGQLIRVLHVYVDDLSQTLSG